MKTEPNLSKAQDEAVSVKEKLDENRAELEKIKREVEESVSSKLGAEVKGI